MLTMSSSYSLSLSLTNTTKLPTFIWQKIFGFLAEDCEDVERLIKFFKTPYVEGVNLLYLPTNFTKFPECQQMLTFQVDSSIIGDIPKDIFVSVKFLYQLRKLVIDHDLNSDQSLSTKDIQFEELLFEDKTDQSYINLIDLSIHNSRVKNIVSARFPNLEFLCLCTNEMFESFQGIFKKLSEINICDCDLKSLNGDQFPTLEVLVLKGLPNFKGFTNTFQNLRDLTIKNNSTITQINVRHFPDLKILTLCNMTSLSYLEDKFQNLEELEITQNTCISEMNGKYFPSLKKLKLVNVINFEKFTNTFQNLKLLEIIINSCAVEINANNFPSLEIMALCKVNNFKKFTGTFQKLKELTIYNTLFINEINGEQFPRLTVLETTKQTEGDEKESFIPVRFVGDFPYLMKLFLASVNILNMNTNRFPNLRLLKIADQAIFTNFTGSFSCLEYLQLFKFSTYISINNNFIYDSSLVEKYEEIDLFLDSIYFPDRYFKGDYEDFYNTFVLYPNEGGYPKDDLYFDCMKEELVKYGISTNKSDWDWEW
jgi:hypothetical protein